MNIQGISMALSAINTKNDVGIAMLSKSLDQNKTAGDGVVKMIDAAAMERSVSPGVGGHFDMKI